MRTGELARVKKNNKNADRKRKKIVAFAQSIVESGGGLFPSD